MDPITHGIAGALIGNAFFSGAHGRGSNRDGLAADVGRTGPMGRLGRTAGVAIFAATLGAVFPDVDVTADLVSRDPLAIVKYHRAITHSFVALPFFAFLLALLTPPVLHLLKRRYPQLAQLQGVESPSRLMLTLIYGIGIASHILLDGMTSFGTRMWYPVSSTRVAWDLLFIVDLAFTCVVLLPQVIAWIYRHQEKSRRRAARAWISFTIGAGLGWEAARTAGYPFHFYIAILASVVFAILFFAPGAGGWGFRVPPARWSQAGMVLMVAYIFVCALGHHTATLRARAFADANRIAAARVAALPIPPSLLDWGDAIRTFDGVYQARFDLRNAQPAAFSFIPDSPPDIYIARAFEMRDVLLYWQFARFPSIHSFEVSDAHVVELGDNRFTDGRRGPQPFTYQVVFDQAGNLLGQGWLRSGMMSYPGGPVPLNVPLGKPGPAAAAGPQGTAR